MRNAYLLLLKNSVIVLIVIFLCLISFVNSSSCLASENANSDIATVGYANNSSVVDVEAEEDQSTATSCESGGYISVRVTETPLLDTLISGFSFFLSVIALALSFCSYRETRNIAKKNIELQTQHNRDEVRPFVSIEGSTNPLLIDIKNHGLGPAILVSMKWLNTEKKIEEDTLDLMIKDELREILRKVDPEKPDYYVSWDNKPFSNNEYDKDILAPGEKRTFIRIEDKLGENLSYNARLTIAESLRNVSVVIEYTDMYSSDTWRIEKDFTWFAKSFNNDKFK